MQFLVSGLISLFLLAFTPAANAQSTPPSPLPKRAITLVVPFAAGGGTDILARLVARKLEASLQQTVIVDNKPGANGVIASQFVERAAPDGTTVMLGSNSTHVIAPLLSPEKGALEATRNNFAMVSILAVTPLVLAVSEKSPYGNLDQFINTKQPGGLTFGTFGAGSSAHLMGALLAAKQGMKLLHVPYKGSTAAITDLLGGTIDSVFLTAAAISTYVDAKQVRALAVTGTERVGSLPEVPTFKERGISGFENGGWFAMFAPAKTPDNVVAFLNAELHKIMAEPDIQARFPDLGLQKRDATLKEDKALWDESISHMQDVIKQTKIDLN
ncbi:MAG TPA: tripartite tricarboxylate transporter substrate binding protein [Tardiphaga sp.]